MTRRDLEEVAESTAALKQQVENIERFFDRAGHKLAEKVTESEGTKNQAVKDKEQSIENL